MLPLAVYGLVGLGLVLLVVRPLLSPLRSIPGPFLARFTDLWYFWRVSKARFEEENQSLHQKYGSIVRYGPNRYSINDPHALKIIYGLGSNFAKSSWYNTWLSPKQPWTIFTDQSIKRHAHNRRLYSNTYSMSALVTYEPFVDECADIFSQRLAEIARSGMPIDMGHWFQCYAFDVIGLITYSKRLGFLDQGDDIGGVMSALEHHLSYATLVGIFPNLHQYLFPINNYLAGERGAGRAYVLSFTQDRIAEHRANPKAFSVDSPRGKAEFSTESFLSKFFAKHAHDPDVFTSYHIQVGLAANMVAGSDTTAISLSAILYYLLKHPRCIDKLREEIDQRRKEALLSDRPTFKEAQDMPYLQAIIKEALRMHPATGLPLERVVPEGGATIAGRFFPEGSIVGINTWVEHRNKQIFGDDAHSFRPERWLSNDEDKISTMNRHWIPFGSGSRTCIGKHISLLEISKLIPRIISDFEFEIDYDGQSLNTDWKTENFWFVKPKGFKTRVRQRSEKGQS